MNQSADPQYIVSVVIPAYNAERTIRRAIDSVLAQTRPADEIIVVDDGSTDLTGEILNSYGGRIIPIRQDNAGASAARNTGIRRASGNWIAFLDADDQWLPSLLEMQINHLCAYPDIEWSYSNYWLIGADEQSRQEAFKINPLPDRTGFIPDYIEAYCQYCIRTSTLIVKKCLLIEAGLFLTTQKDGREDIDIFWKIAYTHPRIGYIHQPLVNYQNESLTSLSAKHRFFADECCNLVERHFKLSKQHGQYEKFCKSLSGKVIYWIDYAMQHKQYHAAGILLKRLGHLIPSIIRFRIYSGLYLQRIYGGVALLSRQKKDPVKKQLSITFILSSFPCLSETFIINQITGIMDLGCKVRIIALNKPGEGKQHSDVSRYRLLEKTCYIQLPKSKWHLRFKAVIQTLSGLFRHPFLMIRLQKKLLADGRKYSYSKLFMALAILKNNCDIVHCHFGNIALIILPIMSLFGQTKWMTSFHGFDANSFVREMGKDVYKELFRRCRFYTCNTNFTKQEIVGIGCPESGISIIPESLKVNKFIMSEKRNPGQSVVILTVGRLVEKKGYEYSIRAVAEVYKTYKNIRYIIAGDGPLRQELRSLAEQLKINDVVNFRGALPEDKIVRLYHEADIFLLPSVTAKNGDMEGQALVLQEAQAAELPVISTWHNGIPDGIIDQKTGFLVKERDFHTISKHLAFLIENPQKRLEMGACGRLFVQDKYDTSVLSDRLFKIYQDMFKEI